MKKIIGYPGCMACGKANPRGLQLDLYFADGRVETRFRIPEYAQGFPGAAHGGILCTILDEVMAWAAIETTGRFYVTGEMNVRFLSPAVTGDEILARGEIAEDKRRYLVCRGEVLAADGKTLAKAEAKFFPVDAGKAGRDGGALAAGRCGARTPAAVTARPERWDVVVIGAGPAGLFAAHGLAGRLSVLVLDEKQRCGGAGALTDGKLNLSPHIGLDLAELGLTEEEATRRIRAVDEVFLRHGADETLYGADEAGVRGWLDRVSWVRSRTRGGEWDITLVPALQRHMGTDLAHLVVDRITASIRGAGAEFRLRTRVEGLARGDDGFFVVRHLGRGTPRAHGGGRPRPLGRLLVPRRPPAASASRRAGAPSTSAAASRWPPRSSRISPRCCTTRNSSSSPRATATGPAPSAPTPGDACASRRATVRGW